MLILFSVMGSVVAQGSGSALRFDTNDRINAGPGWGWLDFPFTLESWVYVDNASSYEPLIETEAGSTTYFGVWWALQSDRRLVISYGDGTGSGGSNRRSFNSTTLVPVGRWVHIASVAIDSVSVRHFINGVETGIAPAGSGLQEIVHNPSGGNLMLGWTAANTSTNWFDGGAMDEIRIWTGVRSETEIREYMCQRLTGSEPNLEAYWRADDASGLVATDAASGAYDGALTSGMAWETSGAAIGDSSVWAYPPSWAGMSLSIPGPGGEALGVEAVSTSPGHGVHLYRVDDFPNNLVGLPPGTPAHYYGVFGSSTSTSYTAQAVLPSSGLSCSGCAIDWVTRNDNAAGPWSPLTGVVGSGCLYERPGESSLGDAWRAEYAWWDSLVIDLTVMGPTFPAELCAGDSVFYAGSWWGASGLVADTLLSATGCDSLVFLDVTVFPVAIAPTMEDSICTGDSLFLAGAWQTVPGLYTDTLLTAAGCDSIVSTNLSLASILLGPTASLSICAGDSVFYAGSWWGASGLIADTLLSATGCDSLIFLDVTVLPVAIAPTLEDSICTGDSLFLVGAWQTVPGLYTDTVLTAAGCDSVITTNLSVVAILLGPTASLSVCAGDSVFFGGGWQSSLGLYTDTVVSSAGCDSIISLNLTLVSPSMGPVIQDTICSGDSTFLASAWQSDAGLYVDTLMATSGCDSLQQTQLTIELCLEDTISPGDDCGLYLPNAFSPNGDGINDGFGLAPETCADLDFFDLVIYNRWGEDIFQTSLVNAKWDGTYKGKLQEIGVYVWVMRFRKPSSASAEAASGTVTLIR